MSASTLSHTRVVNVVIKLSKLCNLRCRYCYEFPELHKPDRMTREQLRVLYQNLADYYVAVDRRDGQRTRIAFIWHGGEPMLAEPEYFWSTFADQADIFGDRVSRTNNMRPT